MFTKYLRTLGFTPSSADTSLLINGDSVNPIFILLYVDDFLIAGPQISAINTLVDTISTQFKLKILGHPTLFLGIQIQRTPQGLFLHQPTYVQKLLETAGLENCKSVATPLALSTTRNSELSTSFDNPTLYRQLAGSLQFLTITRPDIAFAVNQVCQHMHAPLRSHFMLITRILRYLKATINFGLPIHPKSLQLQAYSDSDWAGDQDDRRSTSGFCILLGGSLLSWKVQKQRTVARSSTEAEYRAIANATVELIWLHRLLQELHVPVSNPTTIYCDNTSAIALANNPILHARTKHVEIDHHFIRDNISSGSIQLHHISSVDQPADILTKPLSISRFKTLRDKLTVQPSHRHLEGGCQTGEYLPLPGDQICSQSPPFAPVQEDPSSTSQHQPPEASLSHSLLY